MAESEYTIHYVAAVNAVPPKKLQLAKHIYIAVWIVIIILSVIMQENLFADLAFPFKLLLVLLGIKIFSYDLKTSRIPAQLDIRFTEESISLFREKHYYSNKKVIQELDTFQYSDIEKCIYDKKNQKITVKGKFHCTVYKYLADGTLEKEPCFDDIRTGFRYFYTNLDQTDIVMEINTHTPIQVTIKNP